MGHSHLTIVFGFAALLVPFGSLPAADRVDLGSGEVLFGKILKLTDSEVAIQLGTGGVLTFKRSAIRSFRYAGVDEGAGTARGSREGLGEKGSEGSPKDAPPAPSSSPLPSEAAKGPVLLPPVAENFVLTLENEGIAFSPPAGFQQVAEELPAGVIARFVEPTGLASLAVTQKTVKEPLTEAKKQAVRAYGEVFSSLTVLRNERFKKDGVETQPEAWVVECETEASGQKAHQVQLFTKRGEQLFVLTYTVPSQTHEKHREAIEKCLGSFRLLEAPAAAR